MLSVLSLSVSAGSTLKLTNEADLKTLLCNPDNWGAGTTFVLSKDIAVSAAAYKTGGIFKGGFVPVGTPEKPFRATLIGNDHAITNLKLALSGVLNAGPEYIGLFGCMKNATVRNLTLAASATLSCTFTACALYVGGLAGSCTDSVVQNCGVTFTLKGGFTGTAAGTFSQISTGAFFGKASGVNAFRCTSKLYYTGLSVFSGSVTADVGAFAGTLSDSDLSDCLAGGSVSQNGGMPYQYETSAPLTLNAGGIAGLLTNTSLTSCKSDGAMTLTAKASAGSVNLNGGGLVGQMVSGYIDKCAATGDVIMSGRLSGSGQRALCGGGIVGKIIPYKSVSVFLAACSFTGKLDVNGYAQDGATSAGTAYSAVGGMAGFIGGAGTTALSDCGFFGITDTYEQIPVSTLQTVYSGGIVGRAVTETSSLGITECLSNGAQTVQNGGYVYAGGLLGHVYGNHLTLDTCLFSGSLWVMGDGQYFYGAGAVAYTAAGTSNPKGSNIRGTLTAGKLSVTSKSAALFKASFAYLLRRTNVLSCCAADSGLKAIVSPSLTVSPYSYTTKITTVSTANAGSANAYTSLTKAGGFKWSALFKRPVFTDAPIGYGGALWSEPDADNPIKFPQVDGFYEKGAIVDCAAFTDIPSPYPLSRLVAFSSSNKEVVTVNNGTVRVVGTGQAVVTAVYRQYAADKLTVVTMNRAFGFYVRGADAA